MPPGRVATSAGRSPHGQRAGRGGAGRAEPQPHLRAQRVGARTRRVRGRSPGPAARWRGSRRWRGRICERSESRHRRRWGRSPGRQATARPPRWAPRRGRTERPRSTAGVPIFESDSEQKRGAGESRRDRARANGSQRCPRSGVAALRAAPPARAARRGAAPTQPAQGRQARRPSPARRPQADPGRGVPKARRPLTSSSIS